MENTTIASKLRGGGGRFTSARDDLLPLGTRVSGIQF